VVGDEDTQPLETPIVAPVKKLKFSHVETSIPETSFDFKYLAGLMDHPKLIRNVALIGHLHHGKTLFMDLLVEQTHNVKMPINNELRYTDTRLDEQERGVSIKSQPMSLVLPTLSQKSHLINIMDTPGHVNFSDEQTAALRLADGAVVLIDAAEGVMVGTERALKHAVQSGLRVCVVINKVPTLLIESLSPSFLTIY
jgi:U5 small nuclear ribonucleoprotein component